MDFLFYHRHRGWRLVFRSLLAAMVCFQSLQADPTPSMETLTIDDEGSELILYWHFYYSQLPRSFVMRELPSKTISFGDPQTLNNNVTDLVSVAFDLRVDGKSVSPGKIIKMTVAPDTCCNATVVFPGHPGGEVEVRPAIMQYYPKGYFLNYQIYSPRNIGMGQSGTMLQTGPDLPVFKYRQLAADGSSPPPPSPPRRVESVTATSFTSELRTAWINYNWLFICIVLLLMQMPRRVVVLVISMIACWILLCFLWVVADYKFPYRIPEVVLALPTILVCWITIKYPRSFAWLTLITLGAGLLNACYDMQQIPLANSKQAAAALTGLSLGFVGGLALVLLVVVPLLWECKKYPEFQKEWAPRICWFIATMALVLPLQKVLFG